MFCQHICLGHAYSKETHKLHCEFLIHHWVPSTLNTTRHIEAAQKMWVGQGGREDSFAFWDPEKLSYTPVDIWFEPQERP